MAVGPLTFWRRDAFFLFGAAIIVGCNSSSARNEDAGPSRPRPDEEPLDNSLQYADNVDAVFDILLPAERDANGVITAPGARETGAGKVLAMEGFGLYALAQGFVPDLPGRVVDLLTRAGDAFRAAVNADLDLLAFARRPLVSFRSLPGTLREEIVAAAFDDPTQRSAMLLLRAAVFTAYLGGIGSDDGLRAVGFPPFEDLDGGLAVSGYPRTASGRLIDAEKEDLTALAERNDLDDYTYDRAPAPTPNDDLSNVIGPGGDLR
jgi:hypothetical protein